MRELFHSFKVIGIVLLIPILPFLMLGSQMEQWVEQLRQNPPAAPITAAVISGLLATDIFLPVPSSVVCTLGGYQLGVLVNTAVSWSGLSIGCVLGFALARKWGRSFALWFSTEEELDRIKRLSDRHGPGALVIARGVPMLAEASVLLMGVHGLSWRRFLPPVLLSNLGIALAYSKFGAYAEQHQWLPLALGVSIALPVLLTTLSHWWLRR